MWVDRGLTPKASELEHKAGLDGFKRLGGAGDEPPRGPLPPDILKATRTVHQAAWGQSYSEGRGVMHHGGGAWHRNDLLRKAARWERLAAAARVCAEWLPGDES